MFQTLISTIMKHDKYQHHLCITQSVGFVPMWLTIIDTFFKLFRQISYYIHPE